MSTLVGPLEHASERAIIFDCEGDRMVGIVAAPERAVAVGVLIVVGGPQYRAGSHRQFVLLARSLARGGIAAMRFDCRGMGDADGATRGFEDIAADIAAAIGAFRRACPAVECVVLWGLCDAASAALMYAGERRDPAIAGVVLVNPWVRSDATLARARLRHYYLRRILDRGFWAKLLQGGVRVRESLGGVAESARAARASRASTGAIPDAAMTFRERMVAGMAAFDGPLLLLMSGRDLTAREFDECASQDSRWTALLRRPSVERRDFADADHTFSSAEARGEVETATADWIRRRVLGASQ